MADANQETTFPIILMAGWSHEDKDCIGERCENYVRTVDADFEEVIEEFCTDQGELKSAAFQMLRLTLHYNCQRSRAEGACVLRRTARLIQPESSAIAMLTANRAYPPSY